MPRNQIPKLPGGALNYVVRNAEEASRRAMKGQQQAADLGLRIKAVGSKLALRELERELRKRGLR